MIRDHLHANVTAVSMQEIDETERARLADEVADLLARNT